MDFSWEPVAPWSTPTFGPAAMLGVALALAALTLWTYVGVKRATWRRVGIVLGLRLAALALVFAMMLRPSFAMTQLEGVDMSHLLVIFDASVSMNVADMDGKPSRWDDVNRLWASSAVQARLKRMAAEQKIEVVKYLAAEDLRADEPDALANGKRTDIGAWLHQLWLKHGRDKNLRGIAIFSDGADNGVRFSAQEKARAWRGIAALHAFGAGDPNNAKFKKDIGLTNLKVKNTPIAVKSQMEIDAVAQASGLGKAKVDVVVTIENLEKKDAKTFKEIKNFQFEREKDQHIIVKGIAPEEPGEYKVTMKVGPHPEEANQTNNEISTFFRVIKQKINVLWVDRPRVYEPTYAIRFGLAPEPRFEVRYVNIPAKDVADPHKFYQFDQRHYDVIVIGDVSAKEFSFGDPKLFDSIVEMVEKKGTALLMLGGAETFCKGGWTEHAGFMNLLPVKFDLKGKQAEFVTGDVRAHVTPNGMDLPFLKLEPTAAKNDEIWKKYFDPLEGIAPVGTLAPGATTWLDSGKGVVMAATKASGNGGRVVVFAGDSTWRAWRDRPEAVRAYNRFWKNLVFWLAKEEDDANRLWLALDRRRVNVDAAEALGFTFGLKDKSGRELANAKFTAEVIGPKKHAVRFAPEGEHQRGVFKDAIEPGEYQLVVSATAGATHAKASARFLVVAENIEMLRPAADHEALVKIASESEGRFHALDETSLVQYLDELRDQVNRDSRQKTVYWPDWKRLPASESARDQLPALWSSFALASLLLFVGLIGAEWTLRRLWGLV